MKQAAVTDLLPPQGIRTPAADATIFMRASRSLQPGGRKSQARNARSSSALSSTPPLSPQQQQQQQQPLPGGGGADLHSPLSDERRSAATSATSVPEEVKVPEKSKSLLPVTMGQLAEAKFSEIPSAALLARFFRHYPQTKAIALEDALSSPKHIARLAEVLKVYPQIVALNLSLSSEGMLMGLGAALPAGVIKLSLVLPESVEWSSLFGKYVTGSRVKTVLSLRGGSNVSGGLSGLLRMIIDLARPADKRDGGDLLPPIHNLSVQNLKHGGPEAVSAFARQCRTTPCTTLQVLNFSQCALTSEAADSLASCLLSLPSLIALICHNNPQLRDEGARALCRGVVTFQENRHVLQALQLGLNNCGLTDSSAAGFATALEIHALEVLSLRKNNFSVDGARVICRGVVKSVSILALDLSDNADYRGSCPDSTSLQFIQRHCAKNRKDVEALESLRLRGQGPDTDREGREVAAGL